MADPGGGNKPVPVGGELDPSMAMLHQYLANSTSGVIDGIREGLQQAGGAPNIDISGVSLDSMLQNTRNIMPKVLLDAVDSFATPAGPDLSVKQKPEKKNRGATGSFANVMPPPDDPIAVLTSEADAMGAQAASKVLTAQEEATSLDTKLQVRDHIANSKFNDELLQLIGPDRIVVSRMPAGSKLTAKTPDVKETVDPKTGEVIVHVPQSAMQDAVRTQQNDTKIAAEVVEQARVTAPIFDVEKEMGKLRNLSGAAFSEGVGQLLTSIDIQLAKEQERIRSQAAIKSGLKEAEAALERNIRLDAETGFYTKFNTSSAQTNQARRVVTAALGATTQMEAALIRADQDIARLTSKKNELLKIQVRREGREARKDDLRDTVTSQELLNYHLIWGSSGNDDQDRDTIVARRDKEPAIKRLLQADSTNIASLLVDPSADIRNKAGKLFNEYDRAANGKPQGVDTDLYIKIKKYIDDPNKIIDDAPIIPEEKSKLRTELMQATGKEREALKNTKLASLLHAIVDKTFTDSYDNVKGWKADALNEGSPLRIIVDRVSKTNPTGAAPLKDVVSTFIAETIAGPDGQPMKYKDKIAILQSALRGTVDKEFKSILMTDPTAIQMKVAHKINNYATSAAFAASALPFTSFGGSLFR